MKHNLLKQELVHDIRRWINTGLELKVEHDFDSKVVNERAIQLQCIALKNIDHLFGELIKLNKESKK